MRAIAVVDEHALPVSLVPEFCLLLRDESGLHGLALFLGVLILLVSLEIVEPAIKHRMSDVMIEKGMRFVCKTSLRLITHFLCGSVTVL